MLNYLTDHKKTLWASAMLCAVIMHLALIAVCCQRALNRDIAYSPPMAIMLTFAQAPSRPDIAEEAVSVNVMATADTAQQKQNQNPPPAEKSPPALEKHILPRQQMSEPAATSQPPTQHKAKPRQKKSSEHVKQAKAAVKQISAAHASDFAGAQNSQTTQSDGQAVINWLARVQSHLERQKNYLRRQRASQHSGTTQLQFSVAGNGAIQSIHMLRSSGSIELDQLARHVLKRASPLPKPPTTQIGKTIAVPMIFH